MENNLKPYSEVTDEQLNQWRKEKENVTVIAVPISDDDDEVISEDEDAYFVVCSPSRKVIHAVSHHKNDLPKAERMLIKNCLLAGDSTLLKQDAILSSVLEQIGELSKTRKAKIVKR